MVDAELETRAKPRFVTTPNQLSGLSLLTLDRIEVAYTCWRRVPSSAWHCPAAIEVPPRLSDDLAISGRTCA